MTSGKRRSFSLTPPIIQIKIQLEEGIQSIYWSIEILTFSKNGNGRDFRKQFRNYQSGIYEYRFDVRNGSVGLNGLFKDRLSIYTQIFPLIFFFCGRHCRGFFKNVSLHSVSPSNSFPMGKIPREGEGLLEAGGIGGISAGFLSFPLALPSLSFSNSLSLPFAPLRK